MKVLIIGGGVAGLASALALTKWASHPPDITVIEIRPEPSTIGGAIGLTPNALRCLHNLGVLDQIRQRQCAADIEKIELFTTYTGVKLGEISFIGHPDVGPQETNFKGLRILRADLMWALLDTIKRLPNISLKYGRKAREIVPSDNDVAVTFEDGECISVDLVLGCDGIHSFVRTQLVDPERTPTYTGISAAFGTGSIPGDIRIPWKDTGLCQSQRGTLMTSYFEPERTKQFVAAIMQAPDVVSKDGWRARASEQDIIKSNIKERFGNSSFAFLETLINAIEQWTFYPVYKLAPKGNWSDSCHRIMLLGDAAHAMPPQGESTAHALEDAIIFARILNKYYSPGGLNEAFKKYESIRRPRIDQAYDESVFGWETQKDCGWFTFLVRNWMTSAFLWWTAAARSRRYAEDVATMDI